MIAANTPPRRAADGRSGTDAKAIKIVGHRTALAPSPSWVDWTLMARASNEGYLKVREDFTITEKAPTSTFTFKTLLRHYAKRALTPW